MIFDINTSNKSFLKLSKTLRKKGIKNNKFFLSLYDETLVNVDPRSENLTLEQQARIAQEVNINFWYYIREVVRVPTPGGLSQYEIHSGNLAESFALLNNLNSIVLLPRQHFKTISAVVFYSWIYLFPATNYNIVFSNKELADSQLNIKRCKDIYTNLPKYLLAHMDTKIDTDNINLIRLGSKNNTIKSLSTGRDEASADKLGENI